MKNTVKLKGLKLSKTLPFPFKSIKPENRYISDKNNPPKVSIQFYDNIKNLNNINCFQMKKTSGEILR